MPVVYTSQQKAAISQFTSFTQLDKAAAVRILKSNNWDAQAAVNSYFSNVGGNVSTTLLNSTLKVFEKYRENPTSEPDLVGIEGTMKYFQEADVDLEGLESFAVLEIVQAPAMGEMVKDGFVAGWSALNCDTLAKQKAYVKSLQRSLPDDPEHFDRIYKFTFALALSGTSKQADLAQAIEFWKVLFDSPFSNVKWTQSNTPWLEWWEEFLTEKYKKSVTKDLWNQTLKFARLSLEDDALTFWNEEASWPAVIDEFVDWVKMDKRGGNKDEPMDEDY